MTALHPARILVATDLTPDADEAFRQAATYDQDSTTKFAVVHVAPGAAGYGATSASRAAHVRRSLRDQPDTFLPSGTQVFVEHGRIHVEILRRAAIWGADLIVLGSRGVGGVSARVPDDSIAELVVRHTSIPVLVARPVKRRGTMLVATDLSDPEVPAVAAGAALARERGAELVVMHAIDFDSVAVSLEEIAISVFEPSGRWNLDDELRSRARDKLRMALVKCGSEGEVRVAPGAAATAVMGMVSNLEAELLVVGAHERGRIGRLAHGGVAEHLVRNAPCSVLAVRLAA